MFTVNMPLHIMLADGKGICDLHPAKVIKAGDVIDVEFTLIAAAPPPQKGTEVQILFDFRGKFFQQRTLFGGFAEMPVDGVAIGTFLPVGPPVSAEKRSIFRVSVITSEMTVAVHREQSCELVDISPEGFGGVIAKGTYAPGTLVDVEIPLGDDKVRGKARIQTARQLSPTRTRYGFFIPPSRQDMRKALQRLSVEAQRSQLKRMSRTA